MSGYFQVEEYHRPQNLVQAVDILSRYGNSARVLAGGTDILPRRPGVKKIDNIRHLVDISKLGLDYLKKENDHIRIGAATTINTIGASPLFLSGPYRALSEAADGHSTTTIRNRATVGGNLCNASACADLALPLLVLDAVLVATGPKGEREIPIEGFFKGANYMALDTDEVLLEIRIPQCSEKAGTAFVKLRRQQTAIDMAVVNIATFLTCNKGRCEVAKIALGAVAPISFRAEKAESVLAGGQLSMAEKNVKIHDRGNVAFKFEKMYGDIQDGFKNADIIIENTYRTSKQKHAALEPFGTCLAHYQSNGKLTIYSSTQLPHWSRHYLAGALDLPLNKVRVIKPHTGGSFGGRCGLIHGLEVMCSWLSRQTGRAVRMSFSREEDFIATESRHPMTISMKTGATKDGIITANDVKIVSDVGGYGTHYIGVLADCLSTGVGLYKILNYSFAGTAVFTNKSLCGALRGYGNPQMNFAQESQMDIIAEKLGMDPLELRLKNYRGLGEIDPVLDEEIRSNGLTECLEKGAESCGWEKKRRPKPGKDTRKQGIGLSVVLHGTGAGKALPDPAAATVMINADGSVNLVTAAADEGQGNRTVLAQIVAETLGIEFEKISVSETDTETTLLDCGTHGSRQAYCGGLAVQAAAIQARQKLLAHATKELGVNEDQLRIKEGAIFQTTDPSNRILISDLMRKIQIEDMSVCEQVIGSAAGVAPAMPGYYGAIFAEVEVDTETGEVKVLKLTSAFDVGRAINPDLVEGQITGGAVMGMGFALTENLLLRDGQIRNSSFADYRLLRACDVPEIVPIIVESNEPTGPFGAKGVGEGCMVNVASAISNAIYHATGVRLTDLNMTSEAILQGLRSN